MLLNEVLLNEAQDYGSMFSKDLRNMINTYEPNLYDLPDVMIKKSRTVLKRKDRIVWYLKEMRLQWLRALSNELDNVYYKSSVDTSVADEFRTVLLKEFNRINTGYTLDTIDDLDDEFYVRAEFGYDVEAESIDELLLYMEHYLSLDIRGINEYKFRDQTPSEVIELFTRLEAEYKTDLKRKPLSTSKAEEFLRLNSTWVWFDLKTAGCRGEADAMGHCGNMDEVNDENTTILSLREKKGDKWLPHLTFIYTKAEKALGEMKGVKNNPPSKKFHKYIVPLLRDERIQILSGGGFKAHNNFKLSDLGSKLYNEISGKKPKMAYNSKTDL